MHAKDGALGRVDDGSAEEGAEHPPVADGEGAPIHVPQLRWHCASPSPRGQRWPAPHPRNPWPRHCESREQRGPDEKKNCGKIGPREGKF